MQFDGRQPRDELSLREPFRERETHALEAATPFPFVAARIDFVRAIDKPALFFVDYGRLAAQIARPEA